MNGKFLLAFSPGYSKFYFLLLFSLFLTAAAFAQSVKGTVIDDQNNPLPGATVTVKGTKRATVTDQSGNFTINAGSNEVLVITHVNFLDFEVSVNNRTSIPIKLTGASKDLNEVVITALGIRREAKKLGYSTETVRLNEITQNRTNNLGTSLEGKIAGLDISPPAAGVGSSNKIRLRGQASFAGGENAPLIVINGLPMSQGARGANGTGDQTDDGDNLSLINPDDIESMTVLKGATAAGLYGARAANGAIIITTKNGNRNSGIGVEINSAYNVDEVMDLTDFQYEYGQGQGGLRPTSQANAQNNGQYGFGAKYDGVPTVQFDGVLRPYSPYKNRVEEFFRHGNIYTNSVALLGGNNKGNFRLSYTHQDGEGIVRNNDYHKRTINLGVNYNLTEKFSVQLNANYTNEKNDNPPFVGSQGAGYVNFLYRMSPNIPLSAYRDGAFDADGNERRTTNFNTTLLNPYFDMARRFNYTKRDRLLSTITLRYEFAKWLYLQARANMDLNTDFNEQNVPRGGGNVSNVTMNNAGTGFTGQYSVNNGTTRQMNMDFLLGTNNHFGDFTVDVSVGGNTFTYNNRNSFQRVVDFVVKDLYTIQNGLPSNYAAANSSTSTYSLNRTRMNSLYAFADFGYKSLVFINLTGRNDWFSVLNPKNNNFFYPSASGSFIFSELLKNLSWLNYGKLRGGYAVVGSTNGIDAYEGVLTYNISTYGSYILAALPNNTPNPDLKPFTLTEKEIGLELKMFNNRVNLDIAAYDRITKDQIVSVNNSSASGYNSVKVNYGKLQNRGFEVLLDLVPVRIGSFSWNSAFNGALNKTKVLALQPGLNQTFVAQFNDQAELFGAISNVVGMPLNQITGKTYLRNAKGEIVVSNTGQVQATADNVTFGSALPKYTAGWNNVFRFKQLSLLVHIDGKFGGKMLSGTALNGLRQGFSKASLEGRKPGQTGITFPAVYANGNPNTSVVTDLQGFYGNYRTLNLLDPFVFKSDFIKLRNITLSYDFSSFIGSKFKFVKGVVLSASCRNVAIIKKYIPDIDPESVQSSGDFRVGYEQSALPTARNYGVNLNLKF